MKAGLQQPALGAALVLGSVAAIALVVTPGWVRPKAQTWQFVVGIGMACAVTALPILILLMEKLEKLRALIGIFSADFAIKNAGLRRRSSVKYCYSFAPLALIIGAQSLICLETSAPYSAGESLV